ncbi:MAG: glycosyl transferase family 39 [Geobacter sp.]|nr:MAG: glycosyl transferase family 39 [Geobacter sp.]
MTRKAMCVPGVGRVRPTELVIVALLTGLAIMYGFYGARFYDVMSADGTGYANAGRAFFETGNPRVFGTVFPPLYPFLVGLFSLVLHDLESSARTVSVVFNALTIVPLYSLALRFWGRSAAICSSLLFITLPFLHGMSGVDITEPTYTFFALAAAWAFWSGFDEVRACAVLLSGGALGIAYLARPEGFIVAVMFSCILLLLFLMGDTVLRRPRVGLLLAVFWCGFLVPALPYMNYLHNETGKWQLSGKTGLNSSIIKEYRGAEAPDQHMRLDAKGQEVGGGDSTLLDLMKDDPDIFWGNVRDNLRALPREFANAFPAFLWPFVLLGFAWIPRFAGAETEESGDAANLSLRWHGGVVRLMLAAICAPLLLYVLYFVQPRGFYAYIPVLLMMAGGGCAYLDGLVRRFLGTSSWITVFVPVVFILGCWYVYKGIPGPKPPYSYTQDGGRYDDKQVGLRLREILPEKSVIMTRSGRIGFYSQRPYLMPPQGSFAEIVEYAAKHRVDYLIATLQLLSARPQLEPLYQPLFEPGRSFTPPAGMELVSIGQEPGGIPYIVYRFVR